ncbi:MAG: GcrA family cell cycle regulator [Rhodospirillales bacterium]|nr:GcrA family cell cycle regulator [Rhodospirillales bacterium]
MTIEWTPERTSTLIVLWEEGLSTSEMGRRLGVTKNAVVGKVHRLGLAKRNSPIRSKPRSEPAEVVKMERLGRDMCSWPEGEPGTEGFHFCGRPAEASRPYCPEHCAKAYVKSSKGKSFREDKTEAA